MFRHFSVAHAYLSPGSVGADFNSLAEIVFFEDAPAPMERMAVDGVPASDVPQYWHLAAGFPDMFIAQAESKHLVRFMREHVAAPAISGRAIKQDIKIAIFFSIFSLVGYYIKKML